jgi:hypothetical protein
VDILHRRPSGIGPCDNVSVMIPDMLSARHWPLNYADRRGMMGRLTHYGWLGLAIHPLSPFEIEAILKCVSDFSNLDARVFGPMNVPIEGYGPSILSKEMCVWMRHASDYDRLVNVIEAIPVRENSIQIRRRLTTSERKLLERRNWCVFRTRSIEPEFYLSCETCDEYLIISEKLA